MSIITIGEISLTIPKNRKYTKVIEVRQGSISGSLMNLTGYVVTGYVRKRAAESSELVKPFVITHNNAGGTLTLVMDNSSVHVTASTGYVDLVFTPPGGTPESYAKGPVSFIDLPTSINAAASASPSPSVSSSASPSSSPSAS